jgi:hypothetical protein
MRIKESGPFVALFEDRDSRVSERMGHAGRNLATEPAETESPVARPTQRLLLLRGQWQKQDSHFQLVESAIYLASAGIARGVLIWRSIRSRGLPDGFMSYERVEGSLTQRLDLKGLNVQPYVPKLDPDEYIMQLWGGGEYGVLTGKSRKALSGVARTWDAQLIGTYQFVRERG